jgi:WD40 repeat protein
MGTIRHLAASYDGDVLAAAEFEQIVHLWDLRSFSRLKTFETILDFGGKRLAVSRDGQTVIAGAYRVHGIAAYRASDGAELWRRKDLKKVQRIGFDRSCRQISCCFDSAACHMLETASGETAKTVRGVRKIWESPVGSARLFQRTSDFVLEANELRVAVIPKATFAALSAAFSKSEVCISESGGPVRLFNLKSGELIWRHDPTGGTHFLRLAYSEAIEKFVGASFPYVHGGPTSLSHFDKITGNPRLVTTIGLLADVAFCHKGSRVVTRSGEIFDVESGRLVSDLRFP